MHRNHHFPAPARRKRRSAHRRTAAGRLERVKQIVLREQRRGPFFDETRELVSKLLDALAT